MVYLVKKKDNFDEIVPELEMSEELQNKVEEIITSLKQEVPYPWHENNKNIIPIDVSVDNGTIRVLHIKPDKPISKRPVVFVSGWGSTPVTFQDFYKIVHNRLEFFYVETREKETSKLQRFKADMSISQKAKDVQRVIDYLDLASNDFVLLGACWGGSIILQGLLEKTIKAPTLIVFDPMHYFWYNNFIIKYLIRFLPTFTFYILRPILKFFALRGMKEKVQRQRLETLIAAAVPWKWRKAALASKDFEVLGKLHQIQEEVFVVNGTTDKVHDQRNYPIMTKKIPNGRFIFLKTHESNREFMMGTTALEFSKIEKANGVPPNLADFEKKLIRN